MSESLRHFPQLDPIPTNIRPEKLQAQAEIDSAVSEYLARGGQIHAVDSSHNRNPQFIIGNVIKPDFLFSVTHNSGAYRAASHPTKASVTHRTTGQSPLQATFGSTHGTSTLRVLSATA
jgi:hypothetical protein